MATFTNQATLSYNNTVTSSNVTVGTLVEALSVTKTAVSGSYARGEDVTYVISISNTDTSALTGLTVTDDLGGYLQNAATRYPLTYVDGTLRYYLNGELQTAAPAVTAGPPLTFTGVSVPAGGNAMLIYEAQVNDLAPLAAGSTIVNTASVQGVGVTAAVTDSETVTVSSAPQLAISKSMSPSTVTENSQLTYTFLIENRGNTAVTANDSVILNDTFRPYLSALSVTFNGAAWAEGTNYTYDTAGSFATLAGQITVPAATYAQDAATGVWTITPGTSTLVVSGTV